MAEKNKPNSEKLKFIDLFAGIGGFRLALESFGLNCVYSSEWDKFARQTYESNFGKKPDGDITKREESEIPGHDILCAGFPCQAFSISGKQKGFEDTRGTLFFDIARIAKFHRPKVLFLENVKNLARHDRGNTLETILKTLDDLGYRVFYKILNASNFGVPTARQRIYFVCFRMDLKINNFEFPEKQGVSSSLEQFLEREVKTEKYFIERDDISLKEREVAANVFGEYPQRPVQIGIINKGGQGERIYHPKGHAITLSAHGGGAASKTGAYLINGKIRKLTPKECAGIMGFPEDFIIPVSDAQAYKQFGNSVAIPVIKAVFEKIIKTLGSKNKNYPETEQSITTGI
jgi:DNA (cytosine-5)-methyltransferase 1